MGPSVVSGWRLLCGDRELGDVELVGELGTSAMIKGKVVADAATVPAEPTIKADAVAANSARSGSLKAG